MPPIKIDLYQVHAFDPTMPIEETLRALDGLVHAGKVRYIGCSNFPAWRLADALWTSKLLNLLFRMIEDELIPLSQAHNVGVLVYNPLAAGMLTGRYRQMRTLEQGTRFTLKNSGGMYQRRFHISRCWRRIHQAMPSKKNYTGSLAIIKRRAARTGRIYL